MKRLISLALTVVLVFGIFVLTPETVKAEEFNVTSTTSVEETTSVDETTNVEETTDVEITTQPEITTEANQTDNTNNKSRAVVNTTPHLVSISNATSGIYIKWNAVPGAAFYRVYRRAAGEPYWTFITNTINPFFTDTSADSGNYYRYTVRSVVNGRYSDFENGLYLKRLSDPGSIKTANNVFGVKVTWNKVAGATKYNVYRRLGGTNTWVYVATTTSTGGVDKGAVKGKSYAYSIRAINGTGYSAYNASKCVTIKHI